MNRQCPSCKQVKDLELDFYPSSKNKNGRAVYCKDCCRDKAKMHRATCSDEQAEKHRLRSLAAYHKRKHLPCAIEARKRWDERRKQLNRDRRARCEKTNYSTL